MSVSSSSSSSSLPLNKIRGRSGCVYFGIEPSLVEFYELLQDGAGVLRASGVEGAQNVVPYIIADEPQGVLSAYANEACAWMMQTLIATGTVETLEAAKAIVDAAKSAPSDFTL